MNPPIRRTSRVERRRFSGAQESRPQRPHAETAHGRNGAVTFRTVAFSVLAIITALWGCAFRPEERARALARRAEAAWAEHRYETAVKLWEDARAFSPGDSALALRLADAYNQRFEWDKALALCREILERHPNHPEAWRTVALSAMAWGRMDEALRAVETLKRLDPDGSESRALNGDFLLLQGDPEGALRAYDAALEALSSDERSAADLGHGALPHHGAARRDRRAVVLAKKAACLIALGRRGDAVRLVEALAAASIRNPAVWAHVGRIWELLGDKAQAARAYEAAFEQDPGDLSPMVRRIRLAVEDGRPEEARTALDRLENSGASAAVVGKLRIEWLLSQGHPDEAARIVEKLRTQGAADTEVRLMEAKIRLLEDRPAAALLVLEKILDLEPHIPAAHYLAGLAHLRANHVRLAQKSMIRALELNPAYTEAHLILAATYYKLGEIEPARGHAQALAQREPENPDARILLALCAAEDEAADEAARHVQALRLLGVDAARALTTETLVWDRLGDRERAAETAGRLWDAYPADVDAAWLAVRTLCRNGRSAEAVAGFQRARTLRPDAPFFDALGGDLFLCLGRKEEARAAYGRAVEQGPHTASAYRGLARCEQDSHEARERILRDFRKHVPHSAEPAAALADLFLGKGDGVKARKILEQDLDAHPDSGVLANNLAWLLLETGEDPDRALALAQHAYDRLPDRAEVLDTLGCAYLKKGLFGRALWYLSEARAKDPKNAVAAYHLGLLYAARNDSDHARLHLEAALSLGLSGPEAAHAAAVLDRSR